MNIRELVSRRTDLSTFIVHLTRSHDGISAKDRLGSILRTWRIEARSVFGHARQKLEAAGASPATQKCVCFTETPLEYVRLLTGPIENRGFQFEPYGVAITKRLARTSGANPIWYVDISPGHDWLTNNLNALLDRSLVGSEFRDHDLERIFPFIEQMGSGQRASDSVAYRKEFWWEREWRCVEDFTLPRHVIGLSPEADFDEFRRLVGQDGRSATFIDPSWGLEEIIAGLAGFTRDEVVTL